MKKIFLLVSFMILLGTYLYSQSFDHHSTAFKGTLNFDYLDVTQYEIHLQEINIGNHSIAGFTKITITTLQDNTDMIHLELIELSVDSVFLDGLVAAYNQTDTTVEIPLSNPINPGDTVSLEVYYHGQPYYDDWGGFHFSGDYAFNLGVGLSEIPHNLGKAWFPCIDNFTDRANYDVYATVGEGKMAVCGGLLIETMAGSDNSVTYHWQISHSLPTYLVSIAAGDYVAVRDTFSGMQADIPIDIYVRPQDTVKVAGTFVHLKDVLALYEGYMGPYPWGRVGYVGTAKGAMEHVANIAVPHFTISGSTSYESLMMHELTHMWLGDQVTCASAEEMWLNEGWATFFQMYYTVELYGGELFRESMRDLHADVLQSCHTPGGDGAYFQLNNIPQTHTYGMTAYDKGSTVVQALRFYMGDSLFFETLKAYTSALQYNSATSYDMRDLFTSYSGIDMWDFFENWVFTAGTPHYSPDSFSIVANRDQYYVTVHLKQKRKGHDFVGNSNIVEVTFMDDEWNVYTDTIHFSGPAGYSLKTLPFAPATVFIDLEEKMCDATTDNYKIIDETGDYNYDKTFFKLVVEDISDSAFIQVTHNWAPPDSLKEAVSGLRISDYRYWRVAGIIPESFQATGKFFYSTNSYLDNTLITGETDSVVILYRKDASEDWQPVYFEQIGLWYVGNLIIPELQMGEYTLAVWDTQVSTPEEVAVTDPVMQVYPNPSNDTFMISLEIQDACQLEIIDISGRMVQTYAVSPGQQTITWQPGPLPEGKYFIFLKSKWNEILARKRVIYLH